MIDGVCDGERRVKAFAARDCRDNVEGNERTHSNWVLQAKAGEMLDALQRSVGEVEEIEEIEENKRTKNPRAPRINSLKSP